MVSGQEDLDIKTDPSLVPTHSIYAKRAHLRGTEMAKILRQDAEGTVVLRMNMSQLFSKEGVVKAKMEDVIQKLKGFEVVVTATGFPEHLMKELKPMNIIVEKVTQLPVTPLSHEELKKRLGYSCVCLHSTIFVSLHAQLILCLFPYACMINPILSVCLHV